MAVQRRSPGRPCSGDHTAGVISVISVIVISVIVISVIVIIVIIVIISWTCLH